MLLSCACWGALGQLFLLGDPIPGPGGAQEWGLCPTVSPSWSHTGVSIRVLGMVVPGGGGFGALVCVLGWCGCKQCLWRVLWPKGMAHRAPPEDPRSPWAHQTLRQGQAGSKPSRTPGEEEAEAEEREAEGQEEKLRRASASRRGSGTAGRGRGSRNLPGRLRLAVSRL